MADAEHITQHNGFECYLDKAGTWNGPFSSEHGVDFVDCRFTAKGLFTNEIWRVALFIEDDKVASVDVNIYGEGP
jgi:hypothetical protein